MAKNLDPRAIYHEAYQDRKAHPLQLPGNPYKLADARRALTPTLRTARAVLDYERHPVKGGGDDYLGGCFAHERRAWTANVFRRWIPFVLGYEAVPGLEVMARPDLLKRFSDAVLQDILPAATVGLALPKGVPMMVCLVEVLEYTLRLIDETLAACEVVHA